MQWIRELPLVVQVGDAAALVLAIVLIAVARRRRRKPVAAPVADAPVTDRSAGRRAKAGNSFPRRKRRKLAVEAAQSMGIGVAAPSAPATEQISVPPVEIAEPVVSVPAREEFLAPVVAASDDPYASDAFEPLDAPNGVVVADPGWPTPGELASGFDPDVFDPLPELHEDPEALDDAHDGVDVEAPTGVIEMPDLGAVEMPDFGVTEMRDLDLDEGSAGSPQDWGDGFDPATGWSDDGADDVLVVETSGLAWEPDDDPLAEEPVGVAAPVEAPADLDAFWGEPDDEWVEAEQPVVAEPEIPAEPVSAPSLAAPEVGSGWVEEPAAWPSDEAGEADDLAVPFPPPGTIATQGVWTVQPGASSPVVLDLAGVAASGHALELVIEPNADGRGVRLRIAAATAPERAPLPAVADAVPEEAPVLDPDATALEEAPAEPRDAMAVDDAADVPFLTGGPAPAAGVGVIEHRSDDLDDAADALMPDEPVVTVSAAGEIHPYEPLDVAEAPETVDVADETDPVGGVSEHDDPLEMHERVGVGASVAGVLDDDPAKILADIRARLAALDARRS